jgi:hypothetical protein
MLDEWPLMSETTAGLLQVRNGSNSGTEYCILVSPRRRCATSMPSMMAVYLAAQGCKTYLNLKAIQQSNSLNCCIPALVRHDSTPAVPLAGLSHQSAQLTVTFTQPTIWFHWRPARSSHEVLGPRLRFTAWGRALQGLNHFNVKTN